MPTAAMCKEPATAPALRADGRWDLDFEEGTEIERRLREYNRRENVPNSGCSSHFDWGELGSRAPERVMAPWRWSQNKRNLGLRKKTYRKNGQTEVSQILGPSAGTECWSSWNCGFSVIPSMSQCIPLELIGGLEVADSNILKSLFVLVKKKEAADYVIEAIQVLLNGFQSLSRFGFGNEQWSICAGSKEAISTLAEDGQNTAAIFLLF